MPTTHHTGKAGQFAVMAELAGRGYNVAIPEIDKGDDVFVLNDTTGHLFRLQIKTATGRHQTRADAYRCQFSVELGHVNDPAVGGSHYILVGRCSNRWRFLIIDRVVLADLIRRGLGTENRGTQMVNVLFFRNHQARTSSLPSAVDLSAYDNNWDAFPLL